MVTKTKKNIIRTVSFFLICTMIIALLCGCVNKSEEKYIGIISAMDNEIEILLRECKIDHVDTVADMKFYVGKLKGQPVVITRSGIGKLRNASSVTTMLTKYNICDVVFTGIAGGVADFTNVLDIVVATRLVEHDYGIISEEGFIWRSGDPGYGNQEGEYYYCDENLVNIAYDVAVNVVGNDRVYKGTIATGDQFIASEEYVKRLADDYDAYACEMEGASVAVVCEKFDVPYVVIRALSDKADGKAHESYENMGDIAAANCSEIVIEIIEALGKR